MGLIMCAKLRPFKIWHDWTTIYKIQICHCSTRTSQQKKSYGCKMSVMMTGIWPHTLTPGLQKSKIVRWIVQDLNSTVITLHIPFSQTMIDKFSKFIIMLESWIMKQLRKNVEKIKECHQKKMFLPPQLLTN